MKQIIILYLSLLILFLSVKQLRSSDTDAEEGAEEEEATEEEEMEEEEGNSTDIDDGHKFKDPWECDKDQLNKSNQCIFRRIDGRKVGPHNINMQICEDTYRQIQNQKGNLVKLSTRPLAPCDALVQASWPIVGNEAYFIKMYEMQMPLYDYMMYAPTDLKEWDQLNKHLIDCNIRQISKFDGNETENYYSTWDIKALMEDPKHEDIHHHIVRYLEETTLIVLCLMIDTGTFDRHGKCDQIRIDFGLTEGQRSKCWHDHYETLWWVYEIQFNEIVNETVCYTRGRYCMIYVSANTLKVLWIAMITAIISYIFI